MQLSLKQQKGDSYKLHFFSYRGRNLYAEGVPVARIAKEVGTPVFIYSHKTLKRHYGAFRRAFSRVPHIICYSVKANSNIAVLKTFAEEGSGFDIVSGGELFRTKKAGADPRKIVFSGVGKRTDEIEYAVKSGILMFNVESPQELRAINKIAGRLKKKARIAIRVNPDVDPKTHPYIATGLKKSKFGIETGEAIKEYRYAKRYLKNLDPAGVDCHIGSQITRLGPFIDALKKTRELVSLLRGEGMDIRYLNMGGGLGITYEEERPPHPSMKNFIITDAAMNDLARPSLYGSYHAIKAVRKPVGKEITADVVGPVCESGDFLARARELPPVKPGELLAVMSAGAYGFSMSSNYNSRARAAEIMVKGRAFSVIRKRESIKDLTRGEAVV
jgi:diaminopimelate decarboxylase